MAKIKLNVDYRKSDFEKALESKVKSYGFKLSNPSVEYAPLVIKRNSNKIKGLSIGYRRIPAVQEDVNTGAPYCTPEVVLLDFGKDSNWYEFALDVNNKLMEHYDGVEGFDVKKLAENYKGPLDFKHTVDRDGTCMTPKITKQEFIGELDNILKGYTSKEKRK